MGEMPGWSEGEQIAICVTAEAPMFGEQFDIYVPARVTQVYESAGFVRVMMGVYNSLEFDFFMSDVDILDGDEVIFHFTDATVVE